MHVTLKRWRAGTTDGVNSWDHAKINKKVHKEKYHQWKESLKWRSEILKKQSKYDPRRVQLPTKGNSTEKKKKKDHSLYSLYGLHSTAQWATQSILVRINCGNRDGRVGELKIFSSDVIGRFTMQNGECFQKSYYLRSLSNNKVVT